MSFNYLFYKLPKHVLDSFKFNHGLNYILGALLTFGIVQTNLDVLWYQFSINSSWIFKTGFVSVIAGGLIPIFFPLGLFLYGRFKSDKELQTVALTLGQAAILGLVITSTLKIFTGRVAPEGFVSYHAYGGFRFGFDRGGAFNGWPSSHTAVAFSMATALITLYPKDKVLKICAMLFAVCIGLGVSTNIHWLSDAVAGALIGYAIGKGVGKGFRPFLSEGLL